MRQVPVLLGRAGDTNQRSLESREKSMRRSGGIEPMDIGFAVQNIDILGVEAILKQCLDRPLRPRGVGDCAHNAIGRVRNEVSLSCGSGFHLSSKFTILMILLVDRNRIARDWRTSVTEPVETISPFTPSAGSHYAAGR